MGWQRAAALNALGRRASPTHECPPYTVCSLAPWRLRGPLRVRAPPRAVASRPQPACWPGRSPRRLCAAHNHGACPARTARDTPVIYAPREQHVASPPSHAYESAVCSLLPLPPLIASPPAHLPPPRHPPPGRLGRQDAVLVCLHLNRPAPDGARSSTPSSTACVRLRLSLRAALSPWGPSLAVGPFSSEMTITPRCPSPLDLVANLLGLLH